MWYLKFKSFLLKLFSSYGKPNNVFTNIYNSNFWRSEESLSGPGSELIQTQILTKELPLLFKLYNISSVLDLPCGDFNWMSKVDLSGISYIGGDIVSDLIDSNNTQFRTNDIVFEKIDLINDRLPVVDLILVRDCLVHLSYNDIIKALENIKKSGIKYLLTTTFVDRKYNMDIPTGKWRTLNLQIEPFKFQLPIKVINENCTENNGRYKDKCLCLWEIKNL
jgi:hypothetical protein